MGGKRCVCVGAADRCQRPFIFWDAAMSRIDELNELADLRAEVERLRLLLSLCEARSHIARMRFIELARLIKEKHLARSSR